MIRIDPPERIKNATYLDGRKYKYELLEAITITGTGIVGYSVEVEKARLSPDGTLELYEGYAWNGNSGPAVDTDNWKRPSAAHDAFYQFIYRGLLPRSLRRDADRFMYDILRLEGATRFRSWVDWVGVRLGGWSAVR